MPKFDLGQVVATPGALSALRSSGQTPTEFLHKRTRPVNHVARGERE